MALRVKLKFRSAIGGRSYDVVMELYPDRAPKTVAYFLQYLENGDYAGTIVHDARPLKTVSMGRVNQQLIGFPLKGLLASEADNGLSHQRGTVAAIPGSEPHNGIAGFFFNLEFNPEFSHTAKTDMASWGATVFGTVIEGYAFLRAMSETRTVRRGRYDAIPAPMWILESAEILPETV